jgi:hypothetical protein
MRYPSRRSCLLAAGLLLAVPASAARLPAQDSLSCNCPDLRAEASAGSEMERYLRVLQVAGRAPLYPWSVRAFSPAELDRLLPATTPHPWAARLGGWPGRRAQWLRPEARLVYNSAFPWGGNDGAVWAGRGATASASLGFQLRAGALSLRVQPLLFWAQNRSFTLMREGLPDSTRYRDPDNPGTIDLPQRFGEAGYGRIDPGQSTLRLDLRGFALGVSTANQQWGPGDEMPLLLGNNAGGFPHLFLGTASPWALGIGRLHARVVYGSLAQSPYSPVQGAGSRRFMTGLLATFQPRGLPGLEVGGARFFHTAWPSGGLSLHDFTEPFQSLFKAGLPDTLGSGPRDRSSPDNQLASAFARWVLPRAGFEVWGEYAREDHNWDLQDFLLEPDHASGYSLGARKVWARGTTLTSLRAEWLDTQPGNLLLVRNEGRFYRHTAQRQGHTLRGQLLAAQPGYGGAGSTLAFDRYTPRGRLTLDLSRARVRGLLAPGDSVPGAGGVDVVQSLGGEAVLFGGRSDVMLGLHGDWELNRMGRGDAFNLRATLAVRLGF